MLDKQCALWFYLQSYFSKGLVMLTRKQIQIWENNLIEKCNLFHEPTEEWIVINNNLHTILKEHAGTISIKIGHLNYLTINWCVLPIFLWFNLSDIDWIKCMFRKYNFLLFANLDVLSFCFYWILGINRY